MLRKDQDAKPWKRLWYHVDAVAPVLHLSFFESNAGGDGQELVDQVDLAGTLLSGASRGAAPEFRALQKTLRFDSDADLNIFCEFCCVSLGDAADGAIDDSAE